MRVQAFEQGNGEMVCPMLFGFTLIEVTIALGVFSLVITGVVYAHLLGLRMYNINATKVSASAGARAALNHAREEIRSAKMLYVGTGDDRTFTRLPANTARQGNALQIYPTTDTNSFVRYYTDTQGQKLKRVAGPGGQAVTIALRVTNSLAFSVEDFAGNTLTNDQNSRVIKMSLDFYQWEFPIARAGAGAFYDAYQLQTRVTRRTIE